MVAYLAWRQRHDGWTSYRTGPRNLKILVSKVVGRVQVARARVIETYGPRDELLQRLYTWLGFRIENLPPKQPDPSCWHVWRRVEQDGSPRSVVSS